MFTEPKIISSENLQSRSYVTFYFNGNRKREYSGNNISKSIFPNSADTIEERDRLLRKLKFELQIALENNCYPLKLKDAPKSQSQPNPSTNHAELPKPSTKALLLDALNKKLNSKLSRTYKRNLKYIHLQFVSFLTMDELEDDIANISNTRIEAFLSQFKSSGTYYMNKRRDLGVLFSVVARAIKQSLTSVKETERSRVKATLHKSYDKEQLKPILSYLKAHQYNVYICCLLTYACWLRPHEEVRLLTSENFKNDVTEIHLSGDENKGGKVRVVYVPDYVRVELMPLLRGLDNEDNIFTRTVTPFNDAYFNTQWKRVWIKMFDLKLVRNKQTIYSFRHTAAIQVYRRTKDVYLLQKLLGHSTIVVTIKYLRNLGEFNSQELKDAAPEL